MSRQRQKTKVIKNVASLRGMGLLQIIMNNGWSKYIPNEASPTRRGNPLVLYVACKTKKSTGLAVDFYIIITIIDLIASCGRGCRRIPRLRRGGRRGMILSQINNDRKIIFSS